MLLSVDEATITTTWSSAFELFHNVSVPVSSTDSASGADDSNTRYWSSDTHDDGLFDPSDLTAVKEVSSENVVDNRITVSSPSSVSMYAVLGLTMDTSVTTAGSSTTVNVIALV